MNKKYEKTVEWIVLSCLLIICCVLMFSFFSVGHVLEGILFSLIPIVLILFIKFRLKFVKELALISLGALIVSYFVLVYFLFKTHYIFEGISLVALFICFMFIIKSKKEIIIVLVDALYSFVRFLLVILMAIIIIFICGILFFIIFDTITNSNSGFGITPALIYNLCC